MPVNGIVGFLRLSFISVLGLMFMCDSVREGGGVREAVSVRTPPTTRPLTYGTNGVPCRDCVQNTNEEIL